MARIVTRNRTMVRIFITLSLVNSTIFLNKKGINFVSLQSNIVNLRNQYSFLARNRTTVRTSKKRFNFYINFTKQIWFRFAEKSFFQISFTSNKGTILECEIQTNIIPFFSLRKSLFNLGGNFLPSESTVENGVRFQVKSVYVKMMAKRT